MKFNFIYREFVMWYLFILKYIPGYIGCYLRNILIPYKNGKNVKIYDNVHIDKPKNLKIGNKTHINRGCVLHCGGFIDIGNYVGIGPNVIIYSQNHRYWNSNNKLTDISANGYSFKKVVIGNNVWIGASSIILPGVKIGDNVIVAAGSVVVDDIESNVMVAGVPSSIKKRNGFN